MPNDPHSPDPDDIIAATHVHGPHCAHCGTPTGVEREYAFNDRMIEMLFRAVCHQLGVRFYYKGRSKKLHVFGPDSASLDRLDDRMRDLLPKLDAELMKIAAAFIREHTGAPVTVPKTP